MGEEKGESEGGGVGIAVVNRVAESDRAVKQRPAAKLGKQSAAEMTSQRSRATVKSGKSMPDMTSSKPSSVTKSGKLPVAEPASFSQFFVVLVMHVCKKILLVDTTKLAWFYICSATVISLLTDLFPFPKSYFSDKTNILNQYFVKIGWGWTLMLLAPFVYATSYVLCLGKQKIVYRHLSRLLVATAWWFVVTSIVSIIEYQTGGCSKKAQGNTTKSSCLKNGGNWESWVEISGHSFILVHAILTIAEEVHLFRDWSGLNELLRKEDDKLVSKLNANEFDTLKKLYAVYTPIIRCCLVALTCIQVLWNIMLLSTIVYFHNMPDKFMGVLLAVLCWFLSYGVLYKNYRFVPGPLCPGKNPSFRHLRYN